MKRILVLGAGRSSSSLIHYLLRHAPERGWTVTVGDISADLAKKKVGESSHAEAIAFDIHDDNMSSAHIAAADIVVSLLPSHLHGLAARRCLRAGCHFVTASYVSDELRALDEQARARNLVFLNECGLDPGLDHMSALKVINDIRKHGGRMTSFESFTGGLISKETDAGNPWRYKFTWNPRNVVTAGQGTARYREHGENKYIAYQQLFRRTTTVTVPGHGVYEGYANRDSLKYIETYGLAGIPTLLRGTLRQSGFCATWNILVQLGCCDDTYEMDGADGMTHAGFIDAFLPWLPECRTVEEKLMRYFALAASSPELNMLRWSGFFDAIPIGLSKGSPARILEHILNKKWALREGDKDEIVMWHRFRYELDGIEKERQAFLVATGADDVNTAMAQTVGLPLAVATRLILEDRIPVRGVVIPTIAEFYDPVLSELERYNIALKEIHIR